MRANVKTKNNQCHLAIGCRGRLNATMSLYKRRRQSVQIKLKINQLTALNVYMYVYATCTRMSVLLKSMLHQYSSTDFTNNSIAETK